MPDKGFPRRAAVSPNSDMRGQSWAQRGIAQLWLPIQYPRGCHLSYARACPIWAARAIPPCFPIRICGVRVSADEGFRGPKYERAQLEVPVQYLRGSHLSYAGAEIAKIRTKRGYAGAGLHMLNPRKSNLDREGPSCDDLGSTAVKRGRALQRLLL